MFFFRTTHLIGFVLSSYFRFIVCTSAIFSSSYLFAEPITRIWLTHPVSDASQLMVNWETESPASSEVRFGANRELDQTRVNDTLSTLHQVSIPFPETGVLHYQVRSAEDASEIHSVKSYEGDTLRVALAADWQSYPSLDALLADDPHLLVGAGDLVSHLITFEMTGEPDNIGPFSRLIGRYPALFSRTPFMPALGNHDRQIRPRMFEPLNDPTYDIEAVAFQRFFRLPGVGWKWHLDVPGFDLRFIALDLNHISDMGSNWQSCHPFDDGSAQFQWYRDLMPKSTQRFVVTVYNEQHRQVRQQNDGAWGDLIQQGTMAITGFGLFAERSEVEGFPYLNTALKKGPVYADKGNALFLESVPNYLLLTVPRGKGEMTATFKGLDGATLDETSWPGRK